MCWRIYRNLQQLRLYATQKQLQNFNPAITDAGDLNATEKLKLHLLDKMGPC